MITRSHSNGSPMLFPQSGGEAAGPATKTQYPGYFAIGRGASREVVDSEIISWPEDDELPIWIPRASQWFIVGQGLLYVPSGHLPDWVVL